MPTKQELMDMMDNHLPGEPVTVHDYDQQRPGPSQAYFIAQPAINCTPKQFGAHSHLAYCPSCQVTAITRCEYQNSMMTHIIAAVLFCTTCCCCLPYIFNSCKTARHFCSNCGTYLGAQIK